VWRLAGGFVVRRFWACVGAWLSAAVLWSLWRRVLHNSIAIEWRGRTPRVCPVPWAVAKVGMAGRLVFRIALRCATGQASAS